MCLSLLIIILGESGKTHGNKSSKKRKKPQHPNSYPSGKVLQVTNWLLCQQFMVDQLWRLWRLCLRIAIQEECVSLVFPKICHFGWGAKFVMAMKAKRPETGQVQKIQNSSWNINFHSKLSNKKQEYPNFLSGNFLIGHTNLPPNWNFKNFWLNRKHLFSPYKFPYIFLQYN